MAHMHITLCQSYQQRTQENNTADSMHVSLFFGVFFCNECAINTAVTRTFVVVALIK